MSDSSSLSKALLLLTGAIAGVALQRAFSTTTSTTAATAAATAASKSNQQLLSAASGTNNYVKIGGSTTSPPPSYAPFTRDGYTHVHITGDSPFLLTDFLPCVLRPTSQSVFLLIGAATKPETNEPWCPDCTKANPIVDQALKQSGAILIESVLERAK
jgi:hypothetical protein